MNDYQCDRCRGRFSYPDFDTCVWRCRDCAGPCWWVTAKRVGEGLFYCLAWTVVCALGGVILFSGSFSILPAMVAGVVLGWLGLIGLLIYQG